jgi:hypothetical protein
MKFEYAYLLHRMYYKWDLDQNGHTILLNQFNDRNLVSVLNYLGAKGWELVLKENDTTYVLKRQITVVVN